MLTPSSAASSGGSLDYKKLILLLSRSSKLTCAVLWVPLQQNKICDNIDFPSTFPYAPAFNLSKSIFTSSNIAFQPKTTYVQQTLDFTAVQPLFNAVTAYAASKGLAVTGRGEAHITVTYPAGRYSVIVSLIVSLSFL